MIISAISGDTNVGRDLTISLVSSDNVSAAAISNVMSFEYKQVTIDITHVRLDGRTLVADLPKLWEGTIEFQRKYADVEAVLRRIQDQWYTKDTDYRLGTLTFYVSGNDKQAYTFNDVSLKLEDTRWKGDDVTTSRLAFRAAKFTLG